MNWLRRRLREAVPQSTDEWLLMAAALVLVLVMLMALLAGRQRRLVTPLPDG